MRYSDDYFREIQTLLEAKDQIIKELKEENLKLKEENEKLKEEKERLKADFFQLHTVNQKQNEDIVRRIAESPFNSTR